MGMNDEISANNNAAEANKIARENLAFQKEQYDKWDKTFGPIQENLGNYYKNLGPEKIAKLGIQEQQKSFQVAQQQIKANMARRGLSNTTLEYNTEDQMTFQNQMQQANIRATAEDKVRQQQLGFLQAGYGQQGMLLGNTNQAAGMSVNSRQQSANMYNQRAMQKNQMLYDAITDTIGFGLDFLP